MNKLIFGVVLITLISFTSFGCLGMFEGYGEKAQEYSSADYTISTYQAFLNKYNAICNVGSSAENQQKTIDKWIDLKGGIERAPYWNRAENDYYAEMQTTKDGYIAQYNRLSSEYNKMTEDKTQDWLKIAGLPESVNEYTDVDHLTNSDIIDDKVFGSELLGD